MRSSRHAFISAIVIFFPLAVLECLFLGLSYDTPSTQLRGRSWLELGTSDFKSYWIAYQRVEAGQNPYEPTDGQELVAEAVVTRETNQFFNPPWLLAFLSPILGFGLYTSSRVWLACNVLLALTSSLLVWKARGSNRPALFAALVSTFFCAPVLSVLTYGQLGLLVTVGLAGFLWAVSGKRDIAAGAFLVLASVKPQVSYLPIIAALWWGLSQRRFKFLLTAATGLLLAAGTAELLFPGLMVAWLRNSGVSWQYAESRMSANLVGVLKWELVTRYGIYSPLISVTVITSSIAVLILWLIGNHHRLRWTEHLAPLLCFSVLTANYCWFHDHSILLIPQQILVARAFEAQTTPRARWITLSLLALLQYATIARMLYDFDYIYRVYWYPLAMLGIWAVAGRIFSMTSMNGRMRSI